MPQRLVQIARCMQEIEIAEKDLKANPEGAFLSLMDWMDELHTQLYIPEVVCCA
jgi:type IV secretory pathway TrbF-like protein